MGESYTVIIKADWSGFDVTLSVHTNDLTRALTDAENGLRKLRQRGAKPRDEEGGERCGQS